MAFHAHLYCLLILCLQSCRVWRRWKSPKVTLAWLHVLRTVKTRKMKGRRLMEARTATQRCCWYKWASIYVKSIPAGSRLELQTLQ